jgi:hypothetical protein
VGLSWVRAVFGAYVGLLTPEGGRPEGPEPMMMKAARAFAADGGGGAPALQFQPEEIVVASAVEARFAAR